MIEKIKLIYSKIVSAYYFLKKKAIRFWNRHPVGVTTWTILIVSFIAFFWNNIVISIDSGQEGIKWSRFSGTEISTIYGEGLHIIWPWDKMYIYDTRLQNQTDTMKILSSEGMTIDVEFSFRYYLIKDSIPSIHQTLGVNYAGKFVKPEVEAASLAIIGNFTPEQLYKMSTLIIQSTIKYYLSKQLLEHNIVIDDYLIRKIALPNVISESIEKKIVAEQYLHEYDYKIAIEEKERQRKVIEAKGIRQFEDTSKISILRWKGLEVTSEFAKSKNSKIIIMGGKDGTPIILNPDDKK